MDLETPLAKAKIELYVLLLNVKEPTDREIEIMFLLTFEPEVQERNRIVLGK